MKFKRIVLTLLAVLLIAPPLMPLGEEGLTLDAKLSADTVQAGDSLTVTAAAKGGKTPYKFNYHWSMEDNGISFGIGHEASQVIAYGQTGSVRVRVEDSAGQKADAELFFTIIGGTAEPLALEAKLSADTVQADDSLSVADVTAKGGKAPYEFSYSWYVEENGESSCIGYETSQVILFGQTGSVHVCVKDSVGRRAYEILPFTITGAPVAEPLTLEATLSADTVQAGDSLSVTAVTAKGGRAPYEFSYSWRVEENGASREVGYGASQMISFGQTGSVHVRVKDRVGRETYKTLPFTITGAPLSAEPLKLEAGLSADTVQAGNSLNVTTAAKGGEAPYTYDFSWSIHDNGKSHHLGSEASQVIPFGQTGFVHVRVKDQVGREAYKELRFTIIGGTAEPLALEAKLSADTVNAGNSLAVTATAKGGKPPYELNYLWSVEENGELDYIGQKASQVIRFGRTGAVLVRVKDSVGRGVSIKLPFAIIGGEAEPLKVNSRVELREGRTGKELVVVTEITGGKKPYLTGYHWFVERNGKIEEGKKLPYT